MARRSSQGGGRCAKTRADSCKQPIHRLAPSPPVMAYIKYFIVSERNLCALLPTWAGILQRHQQSKWFDPHCCAQDKHGWGCCLHQPA